ncbi:hypothetical protein KO516_08120 [Citreicella sp. C3M06]|uniref:hypothetical protein n=1 Tax=Citreicella sp. C3M06 TaxID=2841564 RepID=UPI001C088149|nr:hypothetical protein [Citreicella sp. C3M06]MBU2960780.1 hypothetical protein [Citreicella sp. C3M06]
MRYRIQHQPALVERHREQAGARARKTVPRIRITGVFEGDLRAGPHPHLSNHVQGVLGTRGQQDILWPGKDAAPRQQLLRDHLRQERIVRAGIVIDAAGTAGPFEGIARRPHSGRDGKALARQRRGDERIADGGIIGRALHLERVARRVAREEIMLLSHARHMDRLRALFELQSSELLVDEPSRALRRIDHSLGVKLLVEE